MLTVLYILILSISAVFQASASENNTYFNGTEAKIIKLKNYHSQGAYDNTLRAPLMDKEVEVDGFWSSISLWNRAFYSQCDWDSISIIKDHPKLKYGLWMQDKPAPLAIIIPGLGAYYGAYTPAAIAQLLYKQGYSVLVISSGFQWQFNVSASSVKMPGYSPIDAQDIYNAFQKIIKKIKNDNGPKCITRTVLTGYSMGALETLFISSIDAKEKKINFDRFLALDPPVNMLHAVRALDSLNDIWKKWPKDKRLSNTIAIGKKYKSFLMYGFSKNQHGIPLTEDEAKVLIGFSFHQTVVETLYTILYVDHERQDLIKGDYSWANRKAVYKVADSASFEDYLKIFGVPYFSNYFHKKVTLSELNEKSSLYAIADDLKKNPKVRVFHNLDDFLLTPEDRVWLADTLGSRLTYFDYGGHLGNLYLKQYQACMLQALKPAA